MVSVKQSKRLRAETATLGEHKAFISVGLVIISGASNILRETVGTAQALVGFPPEREASPSFCGTCRRSAGDYKNPRAGLSVIRPRNPARSRAPRRVVASTAVPEPLLSGAAELVRAPAAIVAD